MIILPAVDLLDRKAVRLAQGRRDAVTVYSNDPVAMAKRWAEAGATWLHVVDLNGALDGAYTNFPLAKQIVRACPGVKVELSGGIRTKETLQRALEAGAARVVLGTKACEDPQFVQQAADRFGNLIAVAVDARAGQVMSRGWESPTTLTPAALVRSVTMLGVETVICTDVGRDGMMQGPNMTLLGDVLAVGPKQLIASGGIASLDDLRRLMLLEPRGLVGAIIGKALYEQQIDLREALKVVGTAQGVR